MNFFFDVDFRNLFEVVLLLNDHFLLDFRNNLSLSLHDILLNYPLYNMRNRLHMNSLGVDVDRHSFLKGNWNWNFNGFHNDLINVVNNMLFDWNADDLVDMQSYWHFFLMNSHSFLDYLLHLDVCSSLEVLHHNGVSRHFDRSIDSDIHYLLTFNFDWNFNSAWLFDKVLNRRTHYWDFYDLLNNLFDYLRHFNNLFDDPWNDNNLFDNFFDFYAFWYFHYLLDNFLFSSWHFFDFFKVHFHRYNSLFLEKDWDLFLHDIGHVLSHLHRLFFLKNHMLENFNRNMFLMFDGLDERNLVDFGFDFDLGDNQRNFNILLHFANLYFLLDDNFRNLDLNDFDFFDHFEDFFYDFDFFGRFFDYLLNCYYLFHNLRNLHNSFFQMNDWHNLFHDLLNDFHSGFDMRNDFGGLLVSNNLHNFFNDLGDSNYSFLFYDFFDDLLNYDFDWFGHFFLSFKVSNNLFDDFNFLQLLLDNDLVLFDDHRLLNFYDSLHQNFSGLEIGLLADLDRHSFLEFRVRNHLFSVGSQLNRFLSVKRD